MFAFMFDNKNAFASYRIALDQIKPNPFWQNGEKKLGKQFI